MPMFFHYGFGKPIRKEQVRTVSVEIRRDGFVKEVTVWRWVFTDGKERICLVTESYRPCKSGGVSFPGILGRWAWTGERYTEPLIEETA